jgi:hypothetical protein
MRRTIGDGHVQAALLSGRHSRKTVGSRWLSLKNLLRAVDPPSVPPRHAESFYEAFTRESTHWEWDMTTPNTTLYRLGR